MAVKIKVTNDNLALGTELSFGDYFLAKVGEEVIVPDDVLARYEREQGITLEEALAEQDHISVKHATKKEADDAFPEQEEAVFDPQLVLEDVGANTTANDDVTAEGVS